MQNFNPFDEKPLPIDKTFMDWDMIYPCPYNKETVDPYTKCRIVLMNGTEFEAQWFSHNFSRHCPDNDIRRELAMTRRVEQQQQKMISCLKPKDESILEHTITYEQLAVDLTSVLAKQEPNCYARNTLNFALLEDFDHLFRYSNLLDYEYGICPKKLVGCYTEITPARPTISHHRYPKDTINFDLNFDKVDLITKLNIGIITAAEQQTMNYYMNVANLYDKSDLGRKLYQEIGMVEEEHVSQYESLKDTTGTWLEELLLHEYIECYLYYSNLQTECDSYIKRIWEQCLVQEITHLHKAKDLLEKYEGTDWHKVIPCGTFPNILCLHPNIDYVRTIIESTTGNTQKCEYIVPLNSLPMDATFHQYQNIVNHDVNCVPSHQVICQYIDCFGHDYRFEVAPNPLPVLQDRTCDNTTLGRIPCETPDDTQVCGTTAQKCDCKTCTENGVIGY